MGERYRVERTIEAPAERVWGLLADADSRERWNPTIISMTGPIEVGRKVELVSTLDPKRTFKLTVDELSPRARMVWSDGMPLGLFRGIRTYLLAEDDGSTVFSMTEEYTGPLAGLMGKVIPDMAESFDQFADGLKTAAEAT